MSCHIFQKTCHHFFVENECGDNTYINHSQIMCRGFWNSIPILVVLSSTWTLYGSIKMNTFGDQLNLLALEDTLIN